MSVITIIATSNSIIVASDSRVTGGRTHEAFPKIREYQDDIAFFSMGDASFAYNAFKSIDRIKESTHEQMSFQTAVEFINNNKVFLEQNPPWQDFRSLFGVCGINDGKPMAYVTMINPHNTSEFTELISSENSEPSSLVLHPADMDFLQCQEILKSMIPSTDSLNPHQMISACRKAILEMCNYSHVINRRIQYWLYRTSPKTRMNQLIHQIPD